MQPGYQMTTIAGGRESKSKENLPPHSSSPSSRPPSVSSRLSSSGSSPKNSPKLSSNKKLKTPPQDDLVPILPQRLNSTSSVSSLDLGPTPSPTTPTSRGSKTPPRSSRFSSHVYEDAEKIPNSPLVSGVSGGYDRLRKEDGGSFVPPSPQAFSYDNVEKRIKSPSPKSDKSPPLSPPITERELKHMKKYNKEPLINKSETVHHRRNTEYIYIDLPQSETSSECGSIDSRPGSMLYDVPSSRPVSNADFIDSASHYDVPPPPRPSISDTYDVPRSSLLGPPPSTSSSSSSITSRALPHLPNDYVNMKPQKNGFVMEDLYSFIPEGSQGTPSNNTHSASQYYSIDPYAGNKFGDAVKETASGELPGQKLAQEMAEEEGYILVNPATLPAIISPPPTAPVAMTRSVSRSPPLECDNEYIEVRRQPSTSSNASGGSPSSTTPTSQHYYMNVPSRSPSQKKGSNPYEEVTEIRPVLLMNTDVIDIKTLTLSPTPTEEISNETPSITSGNDVRITDSSLTSDQTVTVASQADLTQCPSSVAGQTDPVETGVVPLNNSDIIPTPCHHNITITDNTSDGINSKLINSNTSTEGSSSPPPLPSSLDSSPREETLSNPLEEEYRRQGSHGIEGSSSSLEETGYARQDSMTSSLTDSLTPVEDPSISLAQDSLTVDVFSETQHSSSAPIPLPKTLIPVAKGSPDTTHVISHRKRSLTTGDPLESPQNKEPSKKHTYVNVPAEFVPISPSPLPSHPQGGVGLIKKPMPLPRPANISIITNGITSFKGCYGDEKTTPSCLPLTVNSNCNNNNMCPSKVRNLIRQFSNWTNKQSVNMYMYTCTWI